MPTNPFFGMPSLDRDLDLWPPVDDRQTPAPPAADPPRRPIPHGPPLPRPAEETLIPTATAAAIGLDGLQSRTLARLARAQAIAPAEWRHGLQLHQELYDPLGADMPAELIDERRLLRARLDR
jgi:hypothetical protein